MSNNNQEESKLPISKNEKRETARLLPRFYRTNSNKKFIQSTIDQLMQPGTVKKVNGYIGRQSAKSVTNNDIFVEAVSQDRQDYQLEPAAVIQDFLGNTTFYKDYVDHINHASVLGGVVNDHERLNRQEFYSWNPHINWDMFVNFQQYYWLPYGPPTINVPGQQKALTSQSTSALEISKGTKELVIGTGLTYTSKGGVRIQFDNENVMEGDIVSYDTNTGKMEVTVTSFIGSGTYSEWNVTFKGIVSTYTVKLVDEGDNYAFVFSPNGLTRNPTLTLYRGQTYHFEIVSKDNPFSFKTIRSLGDIDRYKDGISGWAVEKGVITFTVPDNAPEVIFYQSESNIDTGGLIRIDDITENTFLDVETEIIGKKTYTDANSRPLSNGMKVKFTGKVVPEKYATGAWYVEGVGSAISLVSETALDVVGSFAEETSLLFDNEKFEQVPFSATAFYAKDKDYFTINRSSLDLNPWTRYNRWFHVDVITESFEVNDLEVELDQNARATRPIIEFEPGIKLFNYGYVSKERVDLVDNFTTDVFSIIEGTTGYNIDGIDLENGMRILFLKDPDLLVKNKIFKVTFVDVDNPSRQITFAPALAWNAVEGKFTLEQSHGFQNGTEIVYLNNGNTNIVGLENRNLYYSKVIDSFSFELYADETLTEKITIEPSPGFHKFEVSAGSRRLIHLVETEDTNPQDQETVLCRKGRESQGLTYWYDESVQTWKKSQEKLTVNQPPLFDVVDEEGHSYGDTLVYDGSDFAGTKLFSYQVSEVNPFEDPELGIKLSYQNINNVGDIVFNFNLLMDSFSYKEGIIVKSKKTDSGYLKIVNGVKEFRYENGWVTADVVNTQPVVRTYKESGAIKYFPIDMFDNVDNLRDLRVVVYVNGNRLYPDQFELKQATIRYYVVLNESVTTNDVVTIECYTRQPKNEFGHYKIPINLQQNPLNNNLTKFTLGQVIDHLSSIVSNSNNFSGVFPGLSNIRDLGYISSLGTKFVQHSSPLNLALYHLGSKSSNVIRAVEKARDDYGKFKRAFLVMAETLGIDAEPRTHVDAILVEMSKDLPKTKPYYLSDMFGFAGAFTITIEVLDADTKVYPLRNKFNLDSLSSASVLVYLNGDQLLHGRDYVFGNDAFFYINTPLVEGDVIEVVEYESTDGSFCPPTPSKLGLFPKFEPTIFTDTTYLPQIETFTVPNVEPETTRNIYLPAYDELVRDEDITVAVNNNEQELDVDYSIIRSETQTVIQFFNPLPKAATVKIGTPTKVIRGHDGSIIIAFNDYRDQLILELERRIFNNIKVNYNVDMFDVHDYIPGYSRDTLYSKEEFEKVLSPMFFKWTSNINQDYTKYTGYDRFNSFTFNYRGNFAPDGRDLPAFWRAIYKWMLDTDSPHTMPWECLGFSIKPLWWEKVYGPAPYTSNNDILWNDIKEGIIREPGKLLRKVPKFAKPILARGLPVNESGYLISPLDNGYAEGYIDSNEDGFFEFGDQGPVETAWRRSSYYPFAVIQAALLLTPSKTLGTCFDRSRIIRNRNGQLVYKDTNLRLRLKDILVPSTVDSVGTSRTLTAGLINYIVDFIASDVNSSIDQYKEDLSLLTNKLGSKLGGFTSKDKFKLLLDSKNPSASGGVFVPTENYNLVLNTSSPIKKVVYSGVVITKFADGFEISGYNTDEPYFKYHPWSLTDRTIVVGGISDSFAEWTPNRLYVIGKIVRLSSQFYRVKSTHTSGEVFDESLYARLPFLPQVGGREAILRKSWNTNVVLTLSYATKLSTVQEVVDFLAGYGSYLESEGFVFDDFNPTMRAVTNWENSIKEFMFWSTQGWAEGSVLSLSPAARVLTLRTDRSVVQDLLDPFYEYKIFRVDGQKLDPELANVYRSDDAFSISSDATNYGIYGATLYLVQKEHALILDNQTLFNDVIYDLEPGYKQDRLKVVGYISANWTGGFDIPGFIFDTAVIKEWEPWTDYALGDVVKYKEFYYSASSFITGEASFNDNEWILLSKKPEPRLIPNFDYKADQFEDFYDLDSDNFDAGQQKLAQHLIGYQKRQYLENIIKDEVSQYKFYQGMIIEKGTTNVLSKLFDVLGSDGEDSLVFDEEWAVRVGAYGGVDAFDEIEFILDESKFKVNPQPLELVSSIDSSKIDFVFRQLSTELYIKPFGETSPWPAVNFKRFLRSPGYVRYDDVKLSIDKLDDILEYSIDGFVEGDYVWCAFENADWNIYRFTSTSFRVETADYSNNTLVVTADRLPNVLVGDILGFDNQEGMTGFFKVTKVVNRKISMAAKLSGWANPFVNKGIVSYCLKPARVSIIDNMNSVIPPILKKGELVWTDNDGNANWAVMEYNPVYKKDNSINDTTAPTAGSHFGRAVSITTNGLISAISENDKVSIFEKTSLNSWGFTRSVFREQGTSGIIGYSQFELSLYPTPPYTNRVIVDIPPSGIIGSLTPTLGGTAEYSKSVIVQVRGRFTPSEIDPNIVDPDIESVLTFRSTVDPITYRWAVDLSGTKFWDIDESGNQTQYYGTYAFTVLALDDDHYGDQIALSSDGAWLAVAAPYASYVRTVNDPSAIDVSFVGTPSTNIHQGYINLYQRSPATGVYRLRGSLVSQIPVEEDYFGSELAIVKQGNNYVLAIGSPDYTISGDVISGRGKVEFIQIASMIGTSASASTTISDGVVTSISILTFGEDYTAPPTVVIGGSVKLGSEDHIILDGGEGYSEDAVLIRFSEPVDGGIAALGTVTVENGVIVEINITNGGIGYNSTAVPTMLEITDDRGVVIVPSRRANLQFALEPGTGATAVAEISNGKVSAIRLTNGGTGYLTAPGVVLSSPRWRRYASMLTGGSAYDRFGESIAFANSGKTLIISAPDAVKADPATALSNISAGKITSFTVTNGSSGYSFPPEVKLVDLQHARASIKLMPTGVGRIVFSDFGTKYTSNPAVTVVPNPDESGTIVNASVISTLTQDTVTVVKPGRGYRKGDILRLVPEGTIAWVSGGAFLAGELVSTVDGNVYETLTGGTATSTRPTHTANTVTIGSIQFRYFATIAQFEVKEVVLGAITKLDPIKRKGRYTDVTDVKVEFDLTSQPDTGMTSITRTRSDQYTTVSRVDVVANNHGLESGEFVYIRYVGEPIGVDTPFEGQFGPITVVNDNSFYYTQVIGEDDPNIVSGLVNTQSYPSSIIRIPDPSPQQTLITIDWKLFDAIVVTPGSGYTLKPKVRFSPPLTKDGRIAAAYVEFQPTSLDVNSLVLEDPGFGYIVDSSSQDAYTLTAPVVNFLGRRGTGASANADLAGIKAINILYSGLGYTGDVIVEISPPTIPFGRQATAHAVKSGNSIAEIIVDDPGSGYIKSDTRPITITVKGASAAGARAIAEPVLAETSITKLTLTNAGSGYVEPPPVVISGVGAKGSTAIVKARVVLDGESYKLGELIIEYAGMGYIQAPSIIIPGFIDEAPVVKGVIDEETGKLIDVEIISEGEIKTESTDPEYFVYADVRGGKGSSAKATSSIADGVITKITIPEGESGAYYSESENLQVIITGDGTGATATPVLSSRGVETIQLIRGGSGYSVAPTVNFISQDPPSASLIHAEAYAVVNGAGEVSEIVITRKGSGYKTPPIISIDDPLDVGTEAFALATLSEIGISEIIVTNGGTGYTYANVSIGGSATEFPASPVVLEEDIKNGVVTHLNIVNPGTGYVSPPTVVISAAAGAVYSYTLNEASEEFELADTIYAEKFGDKFGASIALDETGQTLAIGAPYYDSKFTNQGKVYVYNISESGKFTLKQEVLSTKKENGELFGATVALTNKGKTLVVNAANGDSEFLTVFDDSLTTFDNQSFRIVDVIVDTGRIDVYNIYNKNFIYGETLPTNNTLLLTDKYGASIAASNTTIVVGAPDDSDYGTKAGSVFSYVKPLTAYPWTVKHYSRITPNINRIAKAYLYNRLTNKLITYIDVVDPIQGKIPGIAEQEIRFKTYFDPAIYTVGNTGNVVDSGTNWTTQQVGMLWWDLTRARFLENSGGETVYRSTTWNRLYKSASIDIYEWVESKYKPSEWDKLADTEKGLALGISGLSRYGDTAYSVKQKFDSATRQFSNTYYFWVKNKTIVPNAAGRQLSARNVSLLIADPIGYGYPCLGFIGTDSFTMVNLNNYLEDQNVVLNVRYWLTDNKDINSHYQWKLISENENTVIPRNIELKWIDSLVGKDTNNKVVPDTNLPIKLRYGVQFKPRQSMFVNRIEALKQYIERVNNVLKDKLIVDSFNISVLSNADPAPTAVSGKWDVSVDTDAELRFIGTATVLQAKLTPIISNGKITGVNIVEPGHGYVNAPYLKIYGTGTGAIIRTIIDEQGRVVDVEIISSGNDYDNTTFISIRPFTAKVVSDSKSYDKWALYTWDKSSLTWAKALTQSYDVTRYWNYRDWYDTGYSQYTKISLVVENTYQLITTEVEIGAVVKVNNIGSGGWALLEKIDNQFTVDYTTNYRVVARQNGTIEFLETLYAFNSTIVGFDGPLFDADSYDNYPTTELRIILNVIKDYILVNNLYREYLKLFFMSLRYAMSEQTLIDWAFKTSFVKAKHNVGPLAQKPNYQADNLDSYESYINEVKPYRTKVREYVSTYSRVEPSRTAVSDFDLLPIVGLDYTVSPLKVNVDETGITASGNEILQYPWKFWYDSVGFTVTELKIVDGGSGYLSNPVVKISGGFGTGATARAFIANGSVNRVELVTHGSGYLKAPVVEFLGGLGTSVTAKPARGVAVIENTVIRSNKISIKFDRITKNYVVSELTETETFIGTGSRTVFQLRWSPIVKFGTSKLTVNGVEILRGDYSLATKTTVVNGTTQYSGELIFENAPIDGVEIEIEYQKNFEHLSATDRINFYYNPTSGQLGKDLAQLMTGVDYGGVTISGLGFGLAGGWDSLPWFTDAWDSFDVNFDDFIVAASSTVTSYELPYVPELGEEINIYHIGTKVDEITGLTVNFNIRLDGDNGVMDTFVGDGQLDVITVPEGLELNEGDRFVFRKSTSDGSITTGLEFDTQLSGGVFNNTSLNSVPGLNPEDINIDGDGFVTPMTSHAPEEVVPGQILDAVSIKVFHRPVAPSPKILFKNYIVDDISNATFNIGQQLPTARSVIVKVNDIILDQDKYIINWLDKTVSLIDPLVLNDIVSVISFGYNSSTLLDYDFFVGDGATNEFVTRAPWLREGLNSLVLVDGQPVDYILFPTDETYVSPDLVGIRFADPVPLNAVVNYSIDIQETTSVVSQQSSIVRSQEIIIAPETTTYELEHLTADALSGTGLKPYNINVVVKKGQEILTPSSVLYFTMKDDVLEYNIPRYRFKDYEVDASQIRVFIDGEQLSPVTDYLLDLFGITITISPDTYEEGKVLDVVFDVGYEYMINNDGTITFATQYPVGEKIEVISFYNHSNLDINRTIDGLVPKVSLDPGSIDYYEFTNKLGGNFVLPRPAKSEDYVWVIKNKRLLTPSFDYILDSDKITIKLKDVLISSDVIQLVIFAEDRGSGAFGYMQFKDMLNRFHYKRINKSKSTTLIRELDWNHAEIHVANGNVLTNPDKERNLPGIIEINGERIEYLTKEGNILKNIRRGTLGTSVPEKHRIGLYVIDFGPSETIPYKDIQLSASYVTTTESTTTVDVDFIPMQSAIENGYTPTTVEDWNINSSLQDSSGMIQADDIDVFVGGYRLRKSPYKVYDANSGYPYSPEGDKQYDADFAVDGTSSSVALSNPVPINTNITVVKRVGKTWTEPGKTLAESNSVPANFIKNTDTIWPQYLVDKYQYVLNTDQDFTLLTDHDETPLELD
jgi:hypothetical protein